MTTLIERLIPRRMGRRSSAADSSAERIPVNIAQTPNGKPSLLYVDQSDIYWGSIDGMWLPLTYERETDTYLFEGQPVKPRGTVENSVNSFSIITRVLGERYKITQALTGTEAYRMIKNSAPDVLLLSSSIGQLDEKELSELERIGIEADPRNPPAKILLDYAEHLRLLGHNTHIGMVLGNDDTQWLHEWQLDRGRPIQPKIYRPLDERTLKVELNLGNYQKP